MLKNFFLLITISAIILASNAVAGPFGFEMGMTLKQIEGTPEKGPDGLYILNNAPKPYSAFKSYVLQVAPKAGLCMIKAIGKDISTNSYGFELKSEFNKMVERLEAIYGNYIIIDLLFPGSIWNEPNEWMMSLIQKERFLGAIWHEDKGSKMSDDLIEIGLSVDVDNSKKGFLVLEYAFLNYELCEAEEAEIAIQEDEAL
jgi:hypothetical protein